MRKLILTIATLSAFALPAGAEAIRLKNGVIINGSIIGQTEYVLSVQTDYGTIAINQREVDTIMPDLHRVLLKGGGEFVGTVLDLDEFNLSLKTDNGVVNIDTAQIASMDIYDYGEAERQKKYVEKKVELEQEALKTLPDSGASQTTAAEVAAGGSLSTSGLSFDPDLEKAFPSKPAVVEQKQIYNYHLHTFQDEKIETPAPKPQEELPPAPEEAETTDQVKKKDTSRNYFALNAGMLNLDLKLKNLHPSSGDMVQDLSGSAVAFGGEYRRKVSDYFWLGANVSFGLVPKEYAAISPTMEMKISGQLIDANLTATLYLNPKSKTRLYLMGGGGGSFLSLDKNTVMLVSPGGGAPDYWKTESTKTASSTNASGVGAIGIERSIADINLGLEFRAHYVPYSGDFEDSRNLHYFALVKASWFF